MARDSVAHNSAAMSARKRPLRACSEKTYQLSRNMLKGFKFAGGSGRRKKSKLKIKGKSGSAESVGMIAA
jgi:hypothetical protein